MSSCISRVRHRLWRYIQTNIRSLMFTANLIGIDTVHHQVLSGADLDQLSEMQLEKIINNVSIFYRVTPKHKLTIVKVSQLSTIEY